MASRIQGITVEIGGDTTKLSKALESVNKSIKGTQSGLKDVNKLLKLDPSNTELVVQKQKMLKDAIEATKEKLATLKIAAQQANEQLANGEITQQQYDALQREIVETEQNLRSLQDQAATTNATLAKIDDAGEKLQNIGSSVENVGKKFLPVTAAVTGLGTAAVKTAADFDSEMSKVSAISGATGDDFDQLRAKAREMGAKTKFSASEAASAMEYMAMAGWKTSDMLNGIEGIMNLAAASGEDLATTSDIVTDALTAFGLSAADSGHFADILAAASSNANTNVSMMGETFKYCAPIAGALGFSAEDTGVATGYTDDRSLAATGGDTDIYLEKYAYAYPVWRCKQKMGKREGEKPRQNGTPDQKLYCREKHGRLSDAERKAANERCPSESIHECALEQSFMEMLYRLKRDYEKNHEASEISTLFHKACEQMYQQMKGNSVSVERLETLDAQIKELEEKLQETIGRQVTAMRDAVLEQNLELNESLAEGNITLDEIDSDIRNGLTGNDIGASFYHADYEEGSEIEAYASLAKDIRQRIESFRKEKETLSQEQGALTVMKKNFDLFIACLKELPEQNAAGMPLKVNGLDVQGSLFRDVDGKPVDGAVASLKRGRLKITPERIAEAPDLLHFEKGIYCAFMKKGTVKGDIVLYETNFGVTLPTCGNQRTLTSFLGFKKCSLDGLVMLVDAPYRVYDNTVQYRRYLRSKAKREQAV